METGCRKKALFIVKKKKKQMKGILKHLAKYYKIHRIYGFQNLVTLPKYL